MKKIFFLTTHFGALQSIALATRDMNIRIQVPGRSLQKHLHYGNFDVPPNALSKMGIDLDVIEEDQYFNSPPDMLICSHPFCQEVMRNHVTRMSAVKPVLLCGYTQGFSVPHDFRYFDALIAIDYPSYIRAQKFGIPSIYYWPWVDFDFWTPPAAEPDSVLIRMFCNGLAQRPAPFPEMFDRLAQTQHDGVLKNYEWLPPLEVRRLLHEASATLSIKPNEGYGYSVIESLSCGRPVFVYSRFINYQTYVNWLVDDESCVYFESDEEFEHKFERFSADKIWRRRLQKKCVEIVRDTIINDQQSLQLKLFLAALLEARPRIMSFVPDTDIFKNEFSSKREIWNILSGKMWWDPIANLKQCLDYHDEYGLLLDLEKLERSSNSDATQFGSTSEFRLVAGAYDIGVLRKNNNEQGFSIELDLVQTKSSYLKNSFRSQIRRETKSWVGFTVEISSDDDPLVIKFQTDSADTLPWAFIRPVSPSKV